MAYTLVTNNNVLPAFNPYQNINLNADLELNWAFSLTSSAGGAILAFHNNVIPNQDGREITLPDATLASPGVEARFYNFTTYSFNILLNDNTTLLVVIEAGQVIDLLLRDTSTSNGEWIVTPFGSGTSDISSLIIQSSDSSITVTNGNITSPGGTINLTLPLSISNIMTNVINTGLLTVTSVSPLVFDTSTITAGANINITDGNGVLGNPIIELVDTVTGLTSLEVGQFSFSNQTLTAANIDTDLILTTSGTGVLNLNGLTIDDTGLVTVPNLTVTGMINNPFIPKARINFTDISGTIVIGNQANVASVARDTTVGQYLIYFDTLMDTINYDVYITPGSDGGSLPFVSRGYPVTRATNHVVITIVDASGEPVSSVPYGVSVMIMSS